MIKISHISALKGGTYQAPRGGARGAVLARARELVEFARRHGFERDEVIQMIETLP